METGLIIGADEFFGLTLCEYMMKEGLQVDITLPEIHTEQRKKLLEERMMWLGRNDLIRVIDVQDSQETYDVIFIQSEDPDQREHIKAQQGMYRLLFKSEGDALKQHEPTIFLPDMFGPWTLDQEKRTCKDHSYFVEDVAKALVNWALNTNQRQEMIHHLKVESQTDVKQAEKIIIDWERQNSTFFDKKQE
ncbi:nad binding enzyme [Bacillus sp. NPDC093026]|uniref:nad binding enzyme n=1 Tax=Bacillus sp. NPDC093026 TaxID=3363948 RepID=UPI00381AF063